MKSLPRERLYNYSGNLVQHYLAIVIMLLSVAFHLTPPDSDSLLVTPVKRRIKSAFKCRINVDWSGLI